MKQSEYLEIGKDVVMRNVGRLPLVLSKAKGSRVWDTDGKEYIDFLMGISVNNFGHCHPAISEAIASQAQKIVHVSNYFYLEEQVEVASELVKLSGYQQVFFSNSGAEANEAAIKLARKFGKVKGGGRSSIVTALHSFHGRTMGALSATGQPKYQEYFQPIVPGFTYAEFNNLDSWKAAITEDTIALMVELVQGEGGVIPADPAFVQGLVDLCREKDLLFIVDEVQTGFGRTGRMFAYEQFGIRPDVITVAKSLGGGVPLGALLVNARANVFEPGDHSTTVGGGGIALAAAKASLQLMQAPGLMEEVQRKGELIQGEWRKWSQDLKAVSGGRGMGLMLALLLNVPAKQVMLECLEEGLIVNAVADQTIRILPALNIPDEDLIAGLAILHRVLQRYQ